MKFKKQELSSPRLKILEKDSERIQKAEKYLEKERKKLMKNKEVVRKKIRKEKELLRLRNKISLLKKRKTR